MKHSRRTVDPLQTSNHWWHHLRLSTQKFSVIMSGAAFAAVLGYVLLTNNTAAQGFAIKELEHQLDQLQTQNERLEVQAADLRSLNAVAQVSQAFSLQPTEAFEYLTPAGGAVALGR